MIELWAKFWFFGLSQNFEI